MNKLVNIVIIVLGLGISTASIADDALPIQTIQSLYSHSMEMSKHFNGFDNTQLLSKFSSPSLKRIFERDEQLVNRDNDLGCIEFDVMWLTNAGGVGAPLYMQQYDYKYIFVGIGEKDGLEPRSLTYEMSCNADACVIDDILLGEEKESFKENMNRCLKDRNA